jgi:hypothetical protein
MEELISKYLDNQLSLAEKEAFEHQIRENPELMLEVEQMRALLQGLSELAMEQNLPDEHPHWAGFNAFVATEDEKFIGNLTKVRREWKDKESVDTPESTTIPPSKQDAKVIVFPWRTMVLAAASIALLIFAWRWFAQPKASAEELFATHFSMDYQLAQDYLDESGFSANAEDTLFQQAIVATQQKRYQPAIVLLNTYVAKADAIYFLRPFAQELLAQLYLQTQQADLALPILNDLALNQSFENHAHCSWLLALTYIQQEQYPKAKGILQSLQNDQDWKVKAQNLLRELP